MAGKKYSEARGDFRKAPRFKGFGTYGKEVRKVVCTAVATLMVASLIVPALAQVEWPAAIKRFERVSPVETLRVEQGAVEAADLELPASLRAVAPLPEGADPASFAQAEPAADVSDGSVSYDYYHYGYVAPKGADGIYAAAKEATAEGGATPLEHRAVYSILYAKVVGGEPVSEVGEVAHRVYGSLEGGALSWYECDEAGNVTGQVVDVPVAWNTDGYQKDEPGTYTVEASFTGYSYAQARPFAKVAVEEKEGCSCGAGEDAEASAHAEGCPLHVHDQAAESGGIDAEAPESEDGATEAEAPDAEQSECACGAAEGERHAEGCPLYAEPAEGCRCAADGGPIDADNFPWAHQEGCPSFSPVECMCREMVEVEIEDRSEDGTVTKSTTLVPGDFSHVHDATNVDCPLYSTDAARFTKLATGEVSYMTKTDIEHILAAQEAGKMLYPVLGTIEAEGSAQEDDESANILDFVADLFMPEKAYAAEGNNGSNDAAIDTFIRSNTPTSGSPSRIYHHTFDGVDLSLQTPGSWADYINTIFMNKGYEEFSWTDAAKMNIHNGWSYSGVVANSSSGTVRDNPLRIPVRENSVWTVYSGEQLRYALNNIAHHPQPVDTVRLAADIDLNGKEVNWEMPVITDRSLIIDGSSHSICNVSLLNSADPSLRLNFFLRCTSDPIRDVLTLKDIDFRSVLNASFATNTAGEGYAGLFRGANYDAQFDRVRLFDSLTYIADKSPSGTGSVPSFLFQGFHSGSIARCSAQNSSLYGASHINPFASNIAGDMHITNCYVANNLIASTGIHSAGFMSCYSGTGCKVDSCFAVNEMYGSYIVGGFKGYNLKSVTNCFSSGKLEGYEQLGGFAWVSQANESVVENCYSTMLVGLRTNPYRQGGFYCQEAPLNSNNSIGLTYTRNCYAAGEVGNFDTDMANNSTKQGGFAELSPSDSSRWQNCYYDKQTSAMREWAAGDSRRVAGVTGVLTTDAKGATGLTSAPGSSGFTGFGDNTLWSYQAEHYPQLNVFANASSADWGSPERAELVRAYSLASTSTVFLNTWDSGYDWDGNGVRTKDPVSYNRLVTKDHKGEIGTYDTVRDITTDAPVTASASWSQMIPGGAPVDYDGDGTADGAAMDVSASAGIEVKSPGMDWWRIGAASGGQEGWRPIRLISYMDVDAGADAVKSPGQSYDHRADVELTMMDSITEDLVVGIDDAQVWSTAKRGGYPDSKKYWAVPTTHMETRFSASKDAWLYTEVWRAKQNPDGSFVTDANGNLVPDLSVKVTGAGTGAGATLTERKWNGEVALYEDTSVERKYVVTYYWMLKDGRYRADDKVVTITPGDYAVRVNVLKAADDSPDPDSLRLGAAEDNALLEPGYSLSATTLGSFEAPSRVPYTHNASAAWKKDRGSVTVAKARLELYGAPRDDGSRPLMGSATVPGDLAEGDEITVPVELWYNAYEYDAVQGADREVAATQTVDVTYTVAQDAEGGLCLRFNKLANAPADEIASALLGGDASGVAATAHDGTATRAYVNDMMYDVELTLWTAEGIPFSFTKVDEEGAPLEGARFQLYGCSHVHDRWCGAAAESQGKAGWDADCNHYNKVEAGAVVAGDGHEETAGEGTEALGCWDASAPLFDATTGADGKVYFDKLVTGDYMLAETETKDGYQLPHGQWMLRVDSVAGTVDVVARGEVPPAFKVDAETGAYSVANYPQWVLPLTGGSGAILATALGAALACGGAALALSRKRGR